MHLRSSARLTFSSSIQQTDIMSSTPNPNRLWTGNSALLSTNARSRLWTGHSRPTTARPQTAASVRHEGSYVIAVLEGRGVSREVGIAALDRDTGHVMLAQVRLLFSCNDILVSGFD